MRTKEKKEAVKVNFVPDTNYVKVELTITQGKMLALVNALEQYESPVGTDLLNMLRTQQAVQHITSF